MSTALVIPTIRKINTTYLEPAINDPDVDLIVVDDTDGSVKPINNRTIVLNYSDQAKLLGTVRDIVSPHKAATCRNAGLYYAWKEGYSNIITTDDDVIVGYSFIDKHLFSLSHERSTYIYSEDGSWVNTIFNKDIFARGFPYEEREGYNYYFKEGPPRKSVLNIGLCNNVLDLNAIDKIDFNSITKECDEIKLNEDHIGSSHTGPSNFPVLTSEYVPQTSMNVAAKHDSAIGLFQLPCKYDFPGYQLNRLEDIWGGIVFQTIARCKGEPISLGSPFVDHSKSGNIGWEMSSEHYAYIISHYLINAVTNARITPDMSYADAYIEIGKYLYGSRGPFFKLFSNMGYALIQWGFLFKERGVHGN